MLTINQYFDGAVASIGFSNQKLPATVGVMQLGEYEFGTQEFETMTVISGELEVLLPNAGVWQRYLANDSFTVDAGQRFKVNAVVDTAYLCVYGV